MVTWPPADSRPSLRMVGAASASTRRKRPPDASGRRVSASDWAVKVGGMTPAWRPMASTARAVDGPTTAIRRGPGSIPSTMPSNRARWWKAVTALALVKATTSKLEPCGVPVLQVFFVRGPRRRSEVRAGEGWAEFLRGPEIALRTLRHSHAEALGVCGRRFETARRAVGHARAGGGEFSRQPEIAGRRSGARLHRETRPRGGDGGALRPGLRGPLGARAGAPLRATRVPYR